MAKLHVSISAEPIFNIGSIEITNSMLTGVVVSALLIIFSYKFSKKFKKTRTPKGVQNLIEMVIEGLLNLSISIAGEKKAREFFPVIATLFIYILFANWTSLLPGVGTFGIKASHRAQAEIHEPQEQEANHQTESQDENSENEDAIAAKTSQEKSAQEQESSFVPLIRPPSADLNSTIALALFSVIGAQVVGFKYLKMGYIKRFINFSGPMQFVMGILDIVSELSRILSFAFRLFGNIFAGEVLLSVMLFLLPFLSPLPFLGLEIFVGLIQALVFAVLTLVFWNMATLSHESY